MGTNAQLTGTYDPSKLIVTIGSVIVSGFGDGDSIKAERYEDNYFLKVGLDGGVARARNSNKTGKIEITLLSTSGANDQLSGFFLSESLVVDGTPIAPFVIADTSGRTVLSATQGWLKKIPSVTFGKEVGTNVWVMDCADLTVFHGGNEL
jgi:hypothetical protein